MSKASYAIRIKSKLAEVDAEIEVLSRQIESCRQKRDELLIAERVLAELGPDDPPEVDGISPRRKEPTVADKIATTLYECGPMRSQDLHAHLRGTWRDDITFETISSTLSRAKAAGKVVLDSDAKLWSAAVIPEDEKGPDSVAAEPSQLDGATGLASTTTGSAV